MPEMDEYEVFAAAARRAGAVGLMRFSSGNMSFRVDGGRMLVKASRAWMADLTLEQIALCSLADGGSLNGRTPSVEIGFHAGILRARSDVNVVLHFQTPAATTLACGRPESVNFFVIPEIPVYIGPIGIVPFLEPGSRQLADAVTEVMKKHNLAILKNHGMVTVGKSYDEAMQRAVFFDLACDIILRGGARIEALPTDAAAQLCRGCGGTA